MDIKLVAGAYKSILAFEWLDIPRFAVITGANGSGKTQLLELLARSAGVVPPSPDAYHRTYATTEPFKARVDCSERLDAQSTVMLRSYWDVADASASVQQVHEQAAEAWNARVVQGDPAMPAPNSLAWEPLWNTLTRETGVRRNDFDRAMFDAALPPNFVLMKDGATNPASMSAAIPLLFVSYAARIHHLRQQRMAVDEIAERLGVFPWTAVSDVLKEAGLPYQMVEPDVPEASWTQAFNANYRLMLKHLGTGVSISPSSLSAGERVIFLAAIWSYFFSQSALNSRAALLLLDEPDAHLHPALTSMFLRVIRTELVERRGMRVIATTHSPSTVALTLEGELFSMSADAPRIRPVADRWEAVAQLTSGLVTVGTHTKVVFVEDADDVAFFTAVQAIVSRGRAVEGFDAKRSLSFIPASKGRGGGGKQMVLQWVGAIETTQVAGIVDRDEDAPPGGRVHTGSRRHLESYLFDPIFIFALLLDENAAGRPVLMPDIDHQKSKSIAALPDPTLQQIANAMVKIYEEERTEHGESEPTEVRYVGGAAVSLPAWLLRCDMKKMFNPLRQRLGVKWDREYLIRKYDVLGVVPVELAEMLTRVQRA